MRILSAFFAVLFTFINPTMIVNVITQYESFFNADFPEKVKITFLANIVDAIKNSDIRIKSYVYGFMIIITCVHIGFTCCNLYGIYSCKVKFMKPLIVDIFASLIFLLIFVLFSLFTYWRLNTFGGQSEKEMTKIQLKNLYVGVGFLIVYILWTVITCMAHHDTRKLRADFMYWIEEERQSMRSRHNVSIDNRSDRSSKGSKASRASKGSARSAKSEIVQSSNQRKKSVEETPIGATPAAPFDKKRTKGDYSSVPTCNTPTQREKKVSVVNARLSVPL